jgi:N-dimethylarginine dimethylaminohydrolase
METFLLCSPDYFIINYSINPWMRGPAINLKLAKIQWNSLRDTIINFGAKVETIDPIPGLPDMVFSANAGVVIKNNFIVSSMKHKERKGESKYFRKWFADKKYNIIDLVPGVTFEGCGDVLIYGKDLIGGYGYRTDLKALEIIAAKSRLNLYSLNLKDPKFYHLDTCFCRVSDTQAIYYPDAFELGEVQKLKGVLDLIPVSQRDAELFICNSMLVNGILLIPSSKSSIARILRNKYGIKTCMVNVSEFLKSGGSIQCLSLKI